MKNILFLILGFIAINSFSQTISEEAKRKFQFGFDLYTDFWQDEPSELKVKSLNPGVNITGSYNFIFGESNLSFSPGLGLGIHNMYSNCLTTTINDSTYFDPTIPESVGYKKAKFTTTYLDIPIELRYKSEGQFRIAVGFKFGFLLKAQTKFKGDDFIDGNTDRVIIKKGKIKNVEKNRYGFTARIGYKWLNLWGYYQLSSLFVKNKGSQMYPISLGISIIPY